MSFKNKKKLIITLSSIGSLSLIPIISTVSTSCGNIKIARVDIVDWKGEILGRNTTIEFEKDGNGQIINNSFQLSIDGNNLGLMGSAKWTSSDPNIIKIDNNGLITLTGNPGKSTITLKYYLNPLDSKPLKDSVTITVKEKKKPIDNNNKHPLYSIDSMKSTTPIVLEGYNYARAIQYNVDQADAGLIQLSKDNNFSTSNDNYNILVDAGRVNNGPNSLYEEYANNLSNNGVKNIDLIIISHFHYDHIGNINNLLNDKKRFSFNNLNVLLNYSEYLYDYNKNVVTATTNKIFENLTTNFKNKAKIYDSKDWLNNQTNQFLKIYQTSQHTNQLGGIQVLAGSDINDKNVNSWTVMNNFEFNDKKILYSGDATGTTFESMTEQNKKLLKSDVYKVAHHGSGTEGSNTLEFLKLINPKEAIISVGKEDKYTLPDTQVLNKLKEVMKDVSKIKGTMPFGISWEEWSKLNPGKPKTDYDKLWNNLMSFIKSNPTINNNNLGYSDMLIDFSKPIGQMVTSLS